MRAAYLFLKIDDLAESMNNVEKSVVTQRRMTTIAGIISGLGVYTLCGIIAAHKQYRMFMSFVRCMIVLVVFWCSCIFCLFYFCSPSSVNLHTYRMIRDPSLGP